MDFTEEHLSEDEIKWLDSLTVPELNEVLWEMNKEYYIERPPTIDQFIDSYDYTGKKFKNTFPYWRDVLHQIFPTPFNSPYNEVILCTGTGGGKTSTAEIILAYDICLTGCLKDPAAYYGAETGIPLLFPLFSSLLTLAGSVNWNRICTLFNEAPWFREKMSKDLNPLSGFDAEPINLFRNIFIQTGSRFHHIMGQGIVTGIMDEAAFDPHNGSLAAKNYNELSTRMATRFMNYSRYGELPGHLIICSSPKEATDFLQDRIKKAQEAESKFTLVKNNVSIWDVDPNMTNRPRFGVFTGNDLIKPFIFDGNEKINKALIKQCIYPPTNLKEQFKKDLNVSIMNYGGIITIREDAFLRDRRAIREAFTHENLTIDGSDELVIPFDPQGKQISDFFNLDYFKNIPYKNLNRFLGIDVAYAEGSDKYGIASVVAIPDDYELIMSGTTNNSSKLLKIKNRKYLVEWAVALKAAKDEEIPLEKFEIFFKYLKKNLGYPIHAISGDTFQSKRTFQAARGAGILDINTSVDRTKDPYKNFRDLLYGRKVFLPSSRLLETELKELRDYPDGVDHPETGSKDLADAVCSAIWAATNSDQIYTLDTIKTLIHGQANLKYRRKSKINIGHKSSKQGISIKY